MKPERQPLKKGEPQAGDTSGGQIYIPGFGWVGNEGGGASGKTAGDMYENGNKIGIMNQEKNKRGLQKSKYEKRGIIHGWCFFYV